MGAKVIIVELDGATWDIIDPMISQGGLPNFKKLKERSAYAEVDTSYLGSPTIWTALYTGKKKEKFGVPFWGINKSRLEAKRIWEIAAERGLRVGVLHSLLTWPPGEVDGFIIPDVFAMGPETYPRKYQNLQKLYLSRHDKSTVLQGYYFLRSFLSYGSLNVLTAFFKFLVSSLLRPQFLNIYRRRLMVVTKLDSNLFLKLYRKHRPRLCTFHFHAIDATSHKFWRYMNRPSRYRHVIHDFYREADRFIGKLLKLLDERTDLVVMGDHGFTEYADGRGIFELNVPALRKLLSIDTAARVVTFGGAFILNLGETAQGADAVRITEKLASAKMRNGTPLFMNVKKLDQNVHFRLPKKILEHKDIMQEVISLKDIGEITFSRLFRKKAFMDTGIHSAGRGIFAACGRKFLQNTNIKKVSIFDITPTLLTLLDLPIGKDMDGDLDRRWFTSEGLRTIEPRYIDSYEMERGEQEKVPAEEYTQQEVEDLEERLKMLGYL
jgi:predicted AlkP superfamily phosphohydrolase/phosphomutase